MVGRHRRVRFDDLQTFESASARARQKALTELAAEAIRLGLD
jgi:uncharacterized protein YbjQ (UPF0145 family)